MVHAGSAEWKRAILALLFTYLRKWQWPDDNSWKNRWIQIIFCSNVYNHKRKAKFESGHTPPKSDRVMAPFLLRNWENKLCPDDKLWKDWWIQVIFATCVYYHEKNVKLKSGHTPPNVHWLLFSYDIVINTIWPIEFNESKHFPCW